MSAKLHAVYSASASHRWVHCSGSIRLSKDVPPLPESEYSKEGTDAHTCLELMLRNRDKAPGTRAFLRSKYGEEMVAIVGEVAERVLARLNATPGAELFIEVKAVYDHVAPAGHGTADVVIVEPFGTLTVIDLKYGAGIAVEVRDNTQLILYAIGVARKFDYNFSDVRLVIDQPRAEHESGPVREWTITIDELIEWEDKLREAAERCEDPEAPLAHGEWCRFCPAKSICPEISRGALQEAQAEFDDANSLVAPEPKSIELRSFSEILPALDKLETWIEGVRERAFAHLQAGKPIKGYKLVAKRSTRKWTDPAKAEKAARERFGKSAFTAPELLSPAKLEQAGLVKEAVAKFVKKHASNISSGVTMARESDNRPALDRMAEATAEFTEIPKGGARALSKSKTKPISKKK